jgi:gamma-glutamylcyclotransferase (GGCT)/AIG2-like uncharacterized protein YtfP
MDTTINKIFVYGSLRKGFKNPAYEYLSSYFSYVGEGKTKGVFLQKDNTPVAIPTNDEHFLIGEIYELNNDAEFSWAFEQLDDYEGLHVELGEEPMYQRKVVDIIFNNEVISAWVYWYNGNVNGLPVIPTNDLLAYFDAGEK